METEQGTLSTIIIDNNGNPIGQVIYRCALCRRICDTSNDAMLHYQLDHIQLHHQQQQQLQQQQQQQKQQQQQHQQQINRANNNKPGSNAGSRGHKVGGGGGQYDSMDQAGSPSANSKIKRSTQAQVAGGSLLKQPSSSSSSSLPPASNSFLKQSQQPCRSNFLPKGRYQARKSIAPLTLGSSDPIHRQYTTTSASRAAKRHSSGQNDQQQATNAHKSRHSERFGNTSSNSLETQASRPRTSAPRHVQRTNQYTANLKAKITAQKTASDNMEEEEDDDSSGQEEQEQEQQEDPSSSSNDDDDDVDNDDAAYPAGVSSNKDSSDTQGAISNSQKSSTQQTTSTQISSDSAASTQESNNSSTTPTQATTNSDSATSSAETPVHARQAPTKVQTSALNKNNKPDAAEVGAKGSKTTTTTRGVTNENPMLDMLARAIAAPTTPSAQNPKAYSLRPRSARRNPRNS